MCATPRKLATQYAVHRAASACATRSAIDPVTPTGARDVAVGASATITFAVNARSLLLVSKEGDRVAAPGEYARPPTIAVLYEDAREARHVKT